MSTPRRLRVAIAGLLAGPALLMLPAAADAADAGTRPATAIFAAGCFWCSEADFEKLPGVLAAESGYTAGHLANPSYEQVSAGGTGHTEAERRAATESRDALLKSGRFREIHTEILAAGTFYPAEAYHQDYYKKNPIRYSYYRNGCRRDERLRELWGKPAEMK